MFPDLPSGFGCVAFGRLSGFGGFSRERETPAELGGRVSAGVVCARGWLGLVVGWWYFSAGGVLLYIEVHERLW